MEKHIIFLYPIHPVIQELKDILEADGTYDINEVDNANEYRQLVGIIGQSVTITSDIKKIQSTIDSQAQLIKNGISKVIILGKLQGFNSEVHQLRVLGVQEILPETTPLKSLQFKLNLFLKSFEAAAEKKEKEKNKESDLAIIKSKKASGSLFDDEVIENLKKLKREAEKEAGKGDVSNAFDFKVFVRNGVTPFSVAPLNLEKKKNLFKPLVVNTNYDRRSVKPSGGKLVFDNAEVEHKELEKVDQLNHYKNKDSKKTSDIEFDKESPVSASSGKFVDEHEPNVFKKIASDRLNNYNHKASSLGEKIKFDNETEDNKELSSDLDERKRLNSYQSHKLTDDLENKKNPSPLSKEEKIELKKKELEEIGNELKRKKSGGKFVDSSNEKKQNPLMLEVIKEEKVRGLKEEGINHKRDKYNPFHVDEIEGKNLKNHEEKEESNVKPAHDSLRLDNFSEKNPYVPFHIDSSDEKDKVDEGNPADKLYQENKMTLDQEKNWGEQTIDYATFDEQQKGRNFVRPQNNSTQPKSEISDEEFSLTYPVYYWPPDGISTFIPLLLEVLQTRPFDQNKLVQFICFMFNKKLGGHLTYFIEREEGKNEVLGSSYLIGNKEWDYQTLYSEFDMTRMQNINVPSWSDTTFQGHTISFVFPFYYNKQRMGFAYAYFELSSIRNQQEALEAELLVVMARTVFLKEFGY